MSSIVKAVSITGVCVVIFAAFGLSAVALAASWEDTAPGALEAFEQGDLRAVKEILRANDFYNYSSERDATPPIKIQALHYALTSGNVELVKYLASLDWLEECKKWSDYCNPIRSAAGHGRIDMITYLISVGFDVNAVDNKWGFSALGDAARAGQIETVHYLCRQGADPSVRNKMYYKTPLEEAKARRRAQTVDSDPERAARIRNNLDKVIEYLESGQCKKE